MAIKTQTLKGFRDFLPSEARKRQYVINTLKEVFESYGFEPLETPALEYEEVLLGKYGDEGNKLMYRFQDQGGRKVALRYDQTVPLARVVAQYPDLPKPFKRYQIQPVWRAENPQKGRYREFLQCDIDTVGLSSALSDSEIIACALDCARKLGFKDVVMNINDRGLFEEVETKYLVVLDKLSKIGEDETTKELVKRGMNQDEALNFISEAKNKQPTENLKKIFSCLTAMGFKEGADFVFNPLIVRGLDYYTSTIFELVDPNPSADGPSLSLAGGGRYDNLIGVFSGQSIPAVGIAFGFDRVVEAMDSLGLFPVVATSAIPRVLVTVFDPKLVQKSIKVASKLRDSGIPTELYLDENTKLEKQLKYADKRGIPYVVIIGTEEEKSGTVTLKNLASGDQKKIKLDDLILYKL